jgi:hypothetical protein
MQSVMKTRKRHMNNTAKWDNMATGGGGGINCKIREEYGTHNYAKQDM